MSIENEMNDYNPTIHTFELSKTILGTDWNVLKKRFFEEASEKKSKDVLHCEERDNYHFLVYKGLKIFGVLIYLNWLKANNGNTLYHRIVIRINPRRLIGDDTYVGVFELTIENLTLLEERVNDIIKFLKISDINKISDMQISRVDICANFYLRDSENFIKVIRRTMTPSGYKKYRYTNTKIPTDGVYFYNKLMNVQIYQKQYQMIKDGYEWRDDELDKATDLIRYEVQLHRNTLHSFEKNKKILSWESASFVKYFIVFGYYSYEFLILIANQIFGRHAYYQEEQVLDVVINSTFHRKTVNQMCFFLDMIDYYSDADKAWETTKLKYPELKWKKLRECFDRTDYSYLYVPTKWNHSVEVRAIFPSVAQLVQRGANDNGDLRENLITEYKKL